MAAIEKSFPGTLGIKVAKVTASGNIKSDLGVLHGMIVVKGDVSLHEGTVGADNTGADIMQLQAGSSVSDGTNAYTLPIPFMMSKYGCYANVTGTTIAYVYYE